MRLAAPAASLATTQDLYERKAFLIIGADLALEQPFLSFQIRANQRHHGAHVYVVTPGRCAKTSHAAKSIRKADGHGTRSARTNCATRSRRSRNW